MKRTFELVVVQTTPPSERWLHDHIETRKKDVYGTVYFSKAWENKRVRVTVETVGDVK